MPSRSLLLSLSLAVALLAGCSKSASSDTSAGPKSVNFGTLEMTYGTPARQDLGNQTACVLTVQPLDAGSCEFYASVERSGKEIAHTRISPAPLNGPVHLSCGGYEIDVTPHIAK